VPATGPYYLSAIHHDGKYLGIGQETFVQTLTAMINHHPPQIVGTDYFIALPCLHLTQPLIALWFVRKWKRVALTLSAYCIVLFPCILLLGQHYLVDMIGGAVVALIALAMTGSWYDREELRPGLESTRSYSFGSPAS
jgi:hypothetical protein